MEKLIESKHVDEHIDIWDFCNNISDIIKNLQRIEQEGFKQFPDAKYIRMSVKTYNDYDTPSIEILADIEETDKEFEERKKIVEKQQKAIAEIKAKKSKKRKENEIKRAIKLLQEQGYMGKIQKIS